MARSGQPDAIQANLSKADRNLFQSARIILIELVGGLETESSRALTGSSLALASLRLSGAC